MASSPRAAMDPYPFRDHRSLAEAPVEAAEEGPVLRPRTLVYAEAREVRELATIALECCSPGPRADLARAERCMARIRGLLGCGE